MKKAKIKRSIGENIFDSLNIFVLFMLCVVTLYPMLHVLFASLSNSNLLVQHRGLLLRPLDANLASYKLVFRNPNILSGFKNSLIILVVGVFVNIIMTALGAYFLAAKNVMLKVPITIFIVFTMWFSGGMVPFYLTVKKLGLINSLAAIILPFMISTYNMIIMRTSFQAVPDSLIESAKLDGAGHFRILFQVVFPLSKAVIAVMVLFYGVDKWNGWFWSSILIQKFELYPIQVILRDVLINNDTSSMTTGFSSGEVLEASEGVKYATTVVATIPILLIYPFIQKYFVQGVMIGAIKG